MFIWDELFGIQRSRVNLGEEVPVFIYRLMQISMLQILSKEHGMEQAEAYFYMSGVESGSQFAKYILNLQDDFSTFIADLQKKLRELKIGVLRIEELNERTGDIVVTFSETVACDDILAESVTMCNYAKGFLAGVLEIYTGMPYEIKEVDAWFGVRRYYACVKQSEIRHMCCKRVD